VLVDKGGNKMRTIKLAAIITAFAVTIGCTSTPKPAPSSGVNTAGSSRTAKNAGGDELDNAIRETSDYLNKRIQKGSKVVFLNIKSDWPDLSEYILFGLTENAVNDDIFTVVDRQQLDLIRAEQNFQWSGEVSDASAQEIGQMLGAQTIVSGSVTTIGSTYRIQARAIEVQTAKIQGQLNQNVDGKGPTIAALTERKAPAGSLPAAAASTGNRTATGTQATQAPATGGTAQTTPATPAAPVAATYKIGDKGPAGGIIFYDKGNNNDGWRYLEAAPADINRKLRPVSEHINTNDCIERAVGKGKSNTEAIMKEAVNKGGGFGWAAQAAYAYTLNGFNDWFLPSRDELHYVYGNLHLNGLGNFKNRYFTSTAYEASISSRIFWVEDFSDGHQNTQTNNWSYRVRPIRQF
jgi:hypothetical protein